MDIFIFTGWTATISAFTTIVMFVTGILFFTKGQPFGTIQDIFSIFQVVSMVPIVIALYTLFRKEAGMAALLFGVLGTIGMFSAATLQSMLVFRKVKYEQTVKTNLTAGLLIGIWLVSIGYFSFVNENFPTGIAVLGIIAGLSYILMMIGFWTGGEKNKLFILSSVTGVIAYSAWAFWLGSLFLAGI